MVLSYCSVLQPACLPIIKFMHSPMPGGGTISDFFWELCFSLVAVGPEVAGKNNVNIEHCFRTMGCAKLEWFIGCNMVVIIYLRLLFENIITK